MVDKIKTVRGVLPCVSPKQFGCTRYVRTVPSTFSLATALQNGERIQDGMYDNISRGRIVAPPVGEWYAIADHDGDNYDIWIEGVSGFETHCVGTSQKDVEGDNDANFPLICESGYLHVEDYFSAATTHHIFLQNITNNPPVFSDKTLTTTGASDTVTLVNGVVQASDLWGMVRILSGTNFIRDFYRIIEVNTTNNTWKLNRVCSIGAGSNAVGFMRTRKSVVGICNFRGCDVSLNVRGSDAILGVDVDANIPRGYTAFDGVRLMHKTGTSPSGKSSLQISAAACQRAIDIAHEIGGVPQGPDNLEFGVINCPSCHSGLYVDTPQAVDIVVEKIWNGGQTCDALMDFNRGGDLLCRYAYGPSGWVLKIRQPVGDNQADFVIEKIKVDHVISAAAKIVDCQDPDGPVRIRIGGAMSSPPTSQVVRIRSAKTGYTDCQLDIHNLGDEEGAYPVRPTRGQWVEKRHPSMSVQLPVAPIFFFDADGYYGWNRDAGWTVTPTSQYFYNITQAPDISPSANVLTPGGATLVLDHGQINNRFAVNFTGSNRLVIAAAPVGIGSAFDDMTIVLVLKPATSPPGSSRIFGATNVDGTLGWVVSMDGSFKPTLRFGGDGGVVSATALEVDRPNTLIITRVAATGTWTISVNGETPQPFAGKTTGTIAAVTGSPHLGMRQTGASAWTDGWKGHISQAIVYEAILDAAQLAVLKKYIRQFGAW